MSEKIHRNVFELSGVKRKRLIVLLAVAYTADDTGFSPASIFELAKLSRLSMPQATAVLHKLVEEGELTRPQMPGFCVARKYL